MRIRGLVAGLIVLLSVLAPGAASAVNDESFSLGLWPGGPGWLGVVFESEGLTYLEMSRLAGFVDKADGSESLEACSGYDTGGCTTASRGLIYAILPPCKTSSQTWCVEGLRARRNSELVNATWNRLYPESTDSVFPGNSSGSMPPGSTPSLWTLPGVTHSGGTDTYLTLVALKGGISRSSAQNPWDPIDVESFVASVYPVVIENGSFRAPWVAAPGWGMGIGDAWPGCAVTTAGSCARRYAFPTDTRFGLTIRLGATPSTFFHGRLTDPQVQVRSTGSGPITIDVEAAPAKTPVVATWQKWQALPESVKALYPDPCTNCGPAIEGFGDPSWMNQIDTRVYLSTPTAGGVRSMNELTTWLDFLGDKATALPGLWTIRSVPREEFGNAQKCFTTPGRINGLVTTNATSYSAGPPVFNAVTQTLDYQVAAPHSTPEGEVFSGSYTLALRSDVARCVYGFTKAPIKASVQVVDSAGQTKVATTSVAEKNGWITLSAQGFDFSKPTVAVKLTGKKKKR